MQRFMDCPFALTAPCYRRTGPENVTRTCDNFLLLGGLGAALLGPQGAMAARSWSAEHEYAGSFLVVGVLYALGAIALSRLRPIAANSVTSSEGAPSVGALLQ